MGVPLDRNPACLADKFAQVFAGELLGRFRTGHVVDAFLADGAVEVANAETLANLRQFHAEHGPIGLDVGEIVEHQPADRQGAQAILAGWLGEALQTRLFSLLKDADKTQFNELMDRALFAADILGHVHSKEGR